MFLAELGRALVPPLLGRPAPYPTFGGLISMLLGGGHLPGQLANLTYGPLESALFVGLLFLMSRALLRRNWAAALVTILVVVALSDGGRVLTGGDAVAAAFDVVSDVVIILALVRFGLLVTTVAVVVDNMITTVPIPPHLSDWSAAAADWTLVLLIGLACFGFHAARSGQPLFGTLLRE
jgi:hypothetical protein